jgi:predicted 2-oxoglutarate/Fe(II)-dependent dioxygenase YbiX
MPPPSPNWGEIPRDAIEIVEHAFFRRIEDIRRAYPSAYGPYGFTYVEYGVGQFFTPHVDGISTTQIAGFGVTLSAPADFDGGELCIETCGSGRLWARGADGELAIAPGADSQSEWYRSLPRTQWLTRCEQGKALFYGSGLTHSSKPVTRGVLKKMLAFISSDRA